MIATGATAPASVTANLDAQGNLNGFSVYGNDELDFSTSYDVVLKNASGVEF